MKKPSLSFIILMLIVSTFVFFEIRDTLNGDKQVFIARILFNSPGAAKRIDVKAYLLNDEQVAEAFKDPSKELKQPTHKELYYKNVSVVLRIKNNVEEGVFSWGTLAYSVDHVNWKKIDVSLEPASPKDRMPFYQYVIPVGVAVPFNDDAQQEPVLIKWVALYSNFS